MGSGLTFTASVARATPGWNQATAAATTLGWHDHEIHLAGQLAHRDLTILGGLADRVPEPHLGRRVCGAYFLDEIDHKINLLCRLGNDPDFLVTLELVNFSSHKRNIIICK